MISLHTTRVRRRRLGVAAAAAGLFAALLTAAPAAATPDPGDAPAERGSVTTSQQAEARAAIRGGDIPGVDEIVHSSNIKHLTNVPKGALKGLNTDLAFQGKYAYVGNYDGFVIYDISNPKKPKTVSEVLCPGSQNDISVSGNLLFLSTDSSRSDDSCSSTTQPATEKSSWEGMKIFDISNKRNPRYIAAVETACGSHTHTLVPDGKKNIYIYVSSYSPNETFPDCQPPHDGISIIKVPVKKPAEGPDRELPGALPGRRQPGSAREPGRLQDDGLPRHHGPALQGPGRRCLHG
ncbi:LVIVD repeat-containing protein OS=Streptomyces microflavus OX=1919 GN=Smic_03210 PE=4 SV=1 [Streptomyces microflavus]